MSISEFTLEIFYWTPSWQREIISYRAYISLAYFSYVALLPDQIVYPESHECYLWDERGMLIYLWYTEVVKY